jgi:hypothetical protein
MLNVCRLRPFVVGVSLSLLLQLALFASFGILAALCSFVGHGLT